MSMRFAALALALCSASVQAENVFVRVYDADPQTLATAKAQARFAHDYGSFTWLEIDASALAGLRASKARIEPEVAGGQLRINGLSVDPTRLSLQRKQAGAPLNADGEGLHLVQLKALSQDSWVAALQTSQLKVLQYYPSNSFLVWGKPADVQAAHLLNFVRASVPMAPDLKIDAVALARANASDNLNVFLYNDGQPEALRAKLAAAGLLVRDFHPAQPDQAFYIARGAASPQSVQALAALPQVVAIGTEYPAEHDDELAAQILTAQFNPNGVGNVPGYAQFLDSIGLDGEGVIWGINDTGSDWDHPDLAGARAGGNDGTCAAAGTFPGDDASGGGHGTHVSGAVAGRGIGDGSGPFSESDGLGYTYGRGVAPRAMLFTSRLNCGFNNQTYVSTPLAAGARGSNNSWNNSGSAPQIRYQASEREYDILVREGDFSTSLTEEFMVIFSAGNSGPGVSTITGPHVAKNIISVGSSNNGRPNASSANLMSSFSSRGPAEDGRIMPTLTAVGGSLASTRNALGGSCSTAIANTSGLYANCSGTSMSTPMLSGAAALVNQFWGKKFSGDKPSPAMVKAILINGARDLAGSGTPGSNDGTLPIPNNDEGWGLINLEAMFAPALKAVYFDQESILTAVGQNNTFTVAAADPARPLRATLVWTDAPGAVNANPAQVNDLDLSVIQAGNTYRGNVFASGVSTTGGSFDRLSNIENVYITNPGSTAATITINAAALNADALAGNGAPGGARQDYALVCSNCVLAGGRFNAANAVSASICRPATSTMLPIGVTAAAGYTGAVQLAATSGAPAVTGSFAPPSVAGGTGSSQLTVQATVAAPAGFYPLLLSARTDTNLLNDQSALELLVSDAPTSVVLTNLPGPGAQNQNLNPTLTWFAAPNALRYLVEVSTNAAFTVGSIVYSTQVTTTSVTLPTALNPGTNYFWRVTASNACGTALASAVSTFTTSAQQCTSSALVITDNTPAGVEQNLTLTGVGSLTDINVRLEAEHTRLSDLRFVLTHVASGATARLFTRLLGCTGDNVQATFDDQSGNTVACLTAAPSITGTARPQDDLARFNGQPVAGTWRLTVADEVTGETGQVSRWCITPAATSSLSLFSDGFE